MRQPSIRILLGTALAAAILCCGCKHAATDAPSATSNAGGTSGSAATAASQGSPTSAPPGGEASSTDSGGGKQLVSPDAEDVVFLYYGLSGEDPSLSEIADLSTASKEFGRAEAHAKIEAQLKAKLDAVKGVKFLQVNLNNSFGQYDEKYKEYDFDLGTGTSIPFTAYGRNVELVLTNGGLAQSWKLDPPDAAEVLRKNGGGRGVRLVLHLRVLDAPPSAGDSRLRIDVRILDYDILSYRGDRLGRVVVTN